MKEGLPQKDVPGGPGVVAVADDLAFAVEAGFKGVKYFGGATGCSGAADEWDFFEDLDCWVCLGCALVSVRQSVFGLLPEERCWSRLPDEGCIFTDANSRSTGHS